jgi:hypothetical protein
MTDKLTPSEVLQKILDALGVDDLNLNSRGLFEDYIRKAARAESAKELAEKVAVEDTWEEALGSLAASIKGGEAEGWELALVHRRRQAKIAEKDVEIERLRGLLWYSWYEMNAIRARDGSPEHICPDYWNGIVDAFEAELGGDCTPWPSAAAKKALAATKKEG